VVRAAVAPPEMKDSVALGLKYVAQTFTPHLADAWLLAPADMPGLKSSTIDRLLAAYLAAGTRQLAIWAPISAGRRGHPVLFPWQLAAEVERLGAHEGIDALVKRNTVRTIEILDASVLEDLDTPEDYRRLGEAENAGPTA
jgi:molybdenum cofactor cytidylyltransferase